MNFDDIVAKLDIIPFLEAQGLVFCNSGSNSSSNKRGWLAETCPFCGEKQRLSVNVSDDDKKGLWRCFKCQESGNVVTFYAKLHNCSNGDAVIAIKKFAKVADDRGDAGAGGRVGTDPSRVDKKDILTNLFNGDDRPGTQGPSEDAADDAQVVSRTSENIGSKGQQTEHRGQRVGEGTAREAARLRDIYSHLVKQAELSEEHSRGLMTNRGLTKDHTDRLAFRSGGQYLKAVIEKMRDVFTDRDLIEAGVLVQVNGSIAYNKQLMEDHILIPYLDEQGEVYYLRPHKLGFKGKAPELYCRYFLRDRPREIVLAEGEFKATALAIGWDIPAIGVAGVATFGGKYFGRLTELLKEFGVEKVTVIFDNEIKDNPNFPNFKEKPEKRYDQEVWAYVLAYKLERQGFITRVGKLPDEWRVQGKVDFDMALAAGHTREEVLKVIDRALPHKEYKQSLPDEARRIVQRKIDLHFREQNIPVQREFNKYIVKHLAGKGKEKQEAWTETISNFVLNIKSSFFTPDGGVVRNVQLVNEYGEVSETFALAPGEMAGLNEWKKFCFSKGNFIFKGDTKDLQSVWELEFLRDTGDLVYMPDRIGYIDNRNLWLFANMAVKEGKVYRPDDDGIIWIEGKGFKPQSLQLGEGGDNAIPTLSEKPVDLADIARKMAQTVGGYEAYMGIGWVIATIFSRDIYQKYKCMPILFSHGKRESGKSTFVRWLMNFFGIETEGAGIAETTQNFIARAFSYYSSLGCWFDEYRNEHKIIAKDGFFRSAYNRQFSGKGTATAFQTKGFSVHGAAAISGEELPKDNGLFTRLIPLQSSAYKRDRTYFEWFNRHCNKFSYLTYYLLLHYDELRPRVMQNIAYLKDALLEYDISDRTAENWAICAGAFDAVILHDPVFIEWVMQACQEIKREGEEEHMLNQFWNDVSLLISEEKLGHNHFRVGGDELYIWFPGVYGVWALYYRSKTGREPFAEHSLRKYLVDEEYFIPPLNGEVSHRVYFGNKKDITLKRALAISISKAPEVIEEIVNMLAVQITE